MEHELTNEEIVAEARKLLARTTNKTNKKIKRSLSYITFVGSNLRGSE